MAMNKRKTTTAIAAGVTALALLLGGTFAWTSISQQAKNEAIVDINPGGRLHDDFNGTNKDVYVENFSSGATGVNIFARIRLDQYFEVGQDAGINKDGTDRKVNVEIGGDINEVSTWETYIPGDLSDTENVQANDNWQWNLGNEDGNLPYYMPTFNKNKDSLKADINGTYEGTTEGDIVHYDDYLVYVDAEGNPKTVTADAIYDWDEDTDDEENPTSITDRNLPIDTADVLTESEEHTAQQITYAANVISMADWLALPAEEQVGDFWVYDTDGWAYWANPIAPGETTGLLLDGINMSKVPDDNYYYGINVVGQFATASDWTMLYEKTGTEEDAMTEEAKSLMELITRATSTEDGGEDDDNTDDITYDGTLTLDSVSSDVEEVTVNTELPVEFDASDIEADATQPDISDVTVTYDTYNEETGDFESTVTLDKDTHYTYTYDEETQTGSLVIIDPDLLYERLEVADKNDVVSGYVDVEEETETAVITIDWYQPNAEGYIYLDAVTTQDNEYTVYVDDSFDLVTLTATEATGVTFTPDVANKTAALTISPFAWNPTTITATDTSGATETVTVVPLFDTIQVTPDMDGTELTLRPGPYGLVADGFAEGTDVEFSFEAIGDDPITRCVILNNSGAYSLSVATAETATSLALVATQGETVVKVTLNLVNTEPSLAPDFAYIDQGELTGMAFEENTYVVSFKAGHDYFLNTSVPHTFEGTVLWSVDETAPAYFGDGTDTTKKESDAVDPRDGLVQIHIAEDATVGSTFVMTVQLTETGADDGMPAVYAVQVNIVAADAETE